MAQSLKIVARALAKAHRKTDRKTIVVKLFPSTQQKEIRLLEVSAAAPTTGEIMPFRFGEDVAQGVDYPSVIILVSPEEWQEVKAGRLPLPAGWDLSTAEDL